MPELPEVETVRRYLEKVIVSKKIKSIDLRYKGVMPDYCFGSLDNLEILNLSRRGKFLIIFLSKQKVLVIHFRMEGKLFYYDFKPNLDKHCHVIFEFYDNTYLVYRDVRKFGKILVRDNSNYLNTKPLNKLGLEPSEIDFNNFFNKLKKSSKEIKTYLLDQSNILGLGNIYVDEVLFYSKIKPTRLANKVSLKETEKIIKNAMEIFEIAIKYKGSTISTFEYSKNHTGNFQKYLKVYGKKTCAICFNKLVKTKINQRGTTYCANCQK